LGMPPMGVSWRGWGSLGTGESGVLSWSGIYSSIGGDKGKTKIDIKKPRLRRGKNNLFAG